MCQQQNRIKELESQLEERKLECRKLQIKVSNLTKSNKLIKEVNQRHLTRIKTILFSKPTRVTDQVALEIKYKKGNRTLYELAELYGLNLSTVLKISAKINGATKP